MVSQEFFSKEKTLPRLIEWFNNLPAGQRTVAPGEMFIIRVKAIENEHGEPIFLIQQTPSNEPYNYLGESVFLWIGETGEDLVATDTSFFELSRHVQTTINVRPMVGRLTLPKLTRMSNLWVREYEDEGGEIPRQVIMEWDGYYHGRRNSHTGGQWRQDSVQLESLQPRWFFDRYDKDSEEMGDAYPRIVHNSIFSGWGEGERKLTFNTGNVNFRWLFEEAWVVINGEHFNLLEGTITETEEYGQFTYQLVLDPINPSPISPDQDNYIEGRFVMNPRPEDE